MSVRILSEGETHQLVAAALMVGVVSDLQEAAAFGRQLRRQCLEAFVWRYPSVDASEYVHWREVFDRYVFVPPTTLEDVGALIDLFEYNVEDDPGWPKSPLRLVLQQLRSRCERLHVS
jgi:hypothetical protein